MVSIDPLDSLRCPALARSSVAVQVRCSPPVSLTTPLAVSTSMVNALPWGSAAMRTLPLGVLTASSLTASTRCCVLLCRHGLRSTCPSMYSTVCWKGLLLEV